MYFTKEKDRVHKAQNDTIFKLRAIRCMTVPNISLVQVFALAIKRSSNCFHNIYLFSWNDN